MGETPAQLLSRAAKMAPDVWICWACGGEVTTPKVKRRVEYGIHICRDKTGNHDRRTKDEIGGRCGVYHESCEPRRDDLAALDGEGER